MELTEQNLAKAQETYRNLCAMMDEDDWKYQKFEEDLVIRFTARGEDIPMDFLVVIDPYPGLIRLFSTLPFNMSKEKMIDSAIAVCAINDRLKNGTFDFDVSDGTIRFRMTQMYMDSEIGKDVFKYMVYCSAQTVDEYNDKFLMLSKGGLAINDFLADINK